MSPATIHHSEAVFSIMRRICGREHDDPMDDLDVNMAIWGIFLNATLRAAVHLGQDYEANLRYVKNHLWNSVGQFFNETGKLVSEQKEITGVSTIKFKDAAWMSTSLGDDPVATWKSKIKWCSEKQSIQGYESNRWHADGVRVENISRIHNVGPPREDSKSNERPTV